MKWNFFSLQWKKGCVAGGVVSHAVAVVTTGHFSEADIHSEKNSPGIQSRQEPPGWDPSQAGNTDIFIPPTASLWCDVDSAAYAGRAAQQFGEFKLKYFSLWAQFLVTKYLPDFLALCEYGEASEPSWVVQARTGNGVAFKSAKPSKIFSQVLHYSWEEEVIEWFGPSTCMDTFH